MTDVISPPPSSSGPISSQNQETCSAGETQGFFKS
jgi:hypothetical protein